MVRDSIFQAPKIRSFTPGKAPVEAVAWLVTETEDDGLTTCSVVEHDKSAHEARARAAIRLQVDPMDLRLELLNGYPDPYPDR